MASSPSKPTSPDIDVHVPSPRWRKSSFLELESLDIFLQASSPPTPLGVVNNNDSLSLLISSSHIALATFRLVLETMEQDNSIKDARKNRTMFGRQEDQLPFHKYMDSTTYEKEGLEHPHNNKSWNWLLGMWECWMTVGTSNLGPLVGLMSSFF